MASYGVINQCQSLAQYSVFTSNAKNIQYRMYKSFKIKVSTKSVAVNKSTYRSSEHEDNH